MIVPTAVSRKSLKYERMWDAFPFLVEAFSAYKARDVTLHPPPEFADVLFEFVEENGQITALKQITPGG